MDQQTHNFLERLTTLPLAPFKATLRDELYTCEHFDCSHEHHACARPGYLFSAHEALPDKAKVAQDEHGVPQTQTLRTLTQGEGPGVQCVQRLAQRIGSDDLPLWNTPGARARALLAFKRPEQRCQLMHHGIRLHMRIVASSQIATGERCALVSLGDAEEGLLAWFP